MGNMSSSGGGGGGSGSGRRRHQHHHSRPPPPPPPPAPPANPQPRPQQPETMPSNRYLFAAATPYPQSSYPTAAPPPPSFLNPSPHPQYYQYNGYHHPPLWSPVPSPPPPPHMDLRRQQNYRGVVQEGAVAGGRYPQQQLHQLPQQQQQQQQYPVNMMQPPAAPYFVEHQKAVTIRNDVNLKKESLCLEPDEQNPGRFLVSFTFDATVAGRISVFFFAKEGNDCTLASVKGGMFEPVTVTFKKGLAQKFRQPSGTGIDLSLFDEAELTKEGDMEVFPLAVKAEAFPSSDDNEKALKEGPMNNNSQITQSVFEKKEKNEYRVKVVKQILWVNGTRYELQEIYGIGNSVDNDVDGNDQGKECVICLSEPRDTTVLPCRHMCMCSECAKLLRFQTNRCPICRQPVERLLEINVKNNSTEND